MPEEKPAPKPRKISKRTPAKAPAPAAPLVKDAAPAASSETAQQPTEAPSVPVKPAPGKRRVSSAPRVTTPRTPAPRAAKKPSAKKPVSVAIAPPVPQSDAAPL